MLLDGRNHPFDPEGASLKDWGRYLITFDSYQRAEALWRAMMSARTPELRLQIFLDAGNRCDGVWYCRTVIARVLRTDCAKTCLADLLQPEERSFYSGLPALVPVWRGCQSGRERGISWTTKREVAEHFARDFTNSLPTLVHAQVPKEHIFAVFVNRQESEIALDYRRLRKLTKVKLC
jgi:hypothetical protein